MRPPLVGLRHVALYVGDLRRAVAFYRDVLGMRLEWMPDDGNAYLTSGTDNLALHQRPSGPEAAEARVLDHIGFAVPEAGDVDAWARYLEGLGVPVLERPRSHRDGSRSLYLRDPEGTRIQLIHHPPISDPVGRPEPRGEDGP